MVRCMAKILGVEWFTAHSLVGIVRVQTPFDGIVYYIGAVPYPSGETMDAQYIADWGAAFPRTAGDILFKIGGDDGG
jgi:hypothetical protein